MAATSKVQIHLRPLPLEGRGVVSAMKKEHPQNDRVLLFLLHMQSSTSALLTFFFHVLNDIGELSLYTFTLFGFQKGV